MSRKEKLEKIKKKLTKRRISFIIIVMFMVYSLAMYGNIQLQKDKKDEVSYIPYTQFQQMIENIQEDIVRYIYRVNIVANQHPQASDYLQNAKAHHGEEDEQANQPVVNKDSIGRNDMCHCGSGRKYKKCCGQGK